MYWFVGYLLIVGVVVLILLARARLPRNDGHPAAARALHVQHAILAGVRCIDLDDKGRQQAEGSSSASVLAGQGDRAVTALRCERTVERWPPRWVLSVVRGAAVRGGLRPMDRPQDRGAVQGADVGGGSAAAKRAVFPDGEGLARVQAARSKAREPRRLAAETRPTCGWPARTRRDRPCWPALAAPRQLSADPADPRRCVFATRRFAFVMHAITPAPTPLASRKPADSDAAPERRLVPPTEFTPGYTQQGSCGI